jgi:epoxyqueuosine reductase
MLLTSPLKTRADELGFNLCGVVRATPSPTLAAYERWIEAGMHADMGYLARPDRVARRRDLSVILPEVRSLIVVGMDYRALIDDSLLSDPLRGRIAAYAWGVDYHDLMQERLEQLAYELGLKHASARVYVDTGAILERSHAHEAGLGFVGKNTLLIHPRRGSYFFIGEILTTLEADSYDTPHTSASMCGTCARCQTACPTSAFPAPYVLDARRCISYHSIENKGWIDRDLRAQFGNWLYGCDVCQDVCPFQRFSPPTQENAFLPIEQERVAPRLDWLLQMDEAQFQAHFAGSAIVRIKHERMLRNACIAAGNSGAIALVPSLLRLLNTSDSVLIRGHSAWALGRLATPSVYSALAQALARETDEAVRAELHSALS